MNPTPRRHLAPRSTLLAAIFFIVAMLAAASCGGDDTPKPAQPTAALPTAAATATAAATIAPSPTAAAAVAKETKETLTVGGVQREAVIYVPAKLSAAKVPAIVMLHAPGANPGSPEAGPAGGPNAMSPRLRSGILIGDEADRLGFVAVFPTGTQAQNNPNSCCNWNNGLFEWGTQTPPDDIAFFRALLDLVVAKYPVDADRISFLGRLAGGGMTQRVACEMSDRIAAFATVGSGYLDNSGCQDMRALSTLIMYGTADPAQAAPAVAAVVEFWRKFDGCTGEPAVTMLTPKTEQRRFGPCKGGTEVVLIPVQGDGNCWWGAFCITGGRLVPSNDPDLKATPVVVQFLLKQTRAGR